jgi:polysaccharide export outer membrane protein
MRMGRPFLRLRSLIAAAVVAATAGQLSAQVPQLPTQLPPGASQVIQSRPDLASQLRQRLEQSGLTPDQIRSRLGAAGYPDSLLDNYLGGGASPDTTAPSSQVLNAVAQLGLLDSAEVDSLQGTAAIDSAIARRVHRGVGADTIDTSGVAWLDSLLLQRALQRVRPPPDLYAYDSTGDSTLARDSLRAVRARIRGLIADTVLSYSAKQRLLRILAPPDSGLRTFGLDLFRRGRTTFQPNLAGPVDANYKVEPGDQLVLILTGQVELARTLIVTRTGFVVIPQVGEVNVANLTLGDLEKVLNDRLGSTYAGIRSGKIHFSINVSRLHTNQIYVVGSVTAPGSYQVSSAGTALTALYAAGGPDANGSFRRVDIRRGGRLVDSLDLYDYLLRGDNGHDIRLETGDVVFVPIHGSRIKVTGDVVRPAIYEVASGETLRDVVRAAGGFSATASRHHVQITRILPPAERNAGAGHDRIVMDVASEDLDRGFGPAVPMEPGDSVHVFAIADRVSNRITLTGDVWMPGAQGFVAGMRLSDALKLAGGPKPDAFYGELLIARMRSDSTRTQLRTSLRSDGTPTDDIILQEDDDIRVFALRQMRPRRFVAIAGAVMKGGRFVYNDGMSVRDLILLAGGVTEGADLHEAEIARMPENRAGGVTAVTIRVPIDSSYATDGSNGAPDRPGVKPIDPPEIPLRPYDNVLILREANWSLPRTVVVTGEVVYPGRYTLQTRDDRLRDILGRAGGLTKTADHDGIRLYRSNNRTGRIGVDMASALDNGRSRENIAMQNGDSIYIPPYTGLVRVTGDVNSPVTVTYIPGKNVYYYINQAGGPSARADYGRAYVIQPDGKVEAIRHHGILPASVPEPRSGATVSVPEKDIRLVQPDNSIAYLGIALQALASLGTLIYLSRH